MVFLFFDGLRKFSKISIFWYAPLLALLLYVVYHILNVNHPSSHTRLLFSRHFKDFFTVLVNPILPSINYLLPNFRFLSLHFLSLLIISVGLFFIISRHRRLIPLSLFCITGIYLSLFIISSAQVCPKYMPLPVMFFALLLGVSFAALQNARSNLARVLALVFIVLILFASLSKIYSQRLGMIQTQYEYAVIINF
jgi:hypothetical protein